ncbi:hypothetical protein THICB2_510007 [Thiomonas sp. CB2]|nr:hypothetical protein THICB2_510007 [Thiomonas sp. CB2]VDY04335.1 protein of unknown function [Thiomonas sp. Bio17B3]
MPRCSYRLLASFFSHCWSSLSDILADPGAARQYFNGLLTNTCEGFLTIIRSTMMQK